ncbi:MAG TPA: cation diffusion facilitator family transporter [Thermoanaerobaculia bacterium]|nr:cation diffusion facilitator family transporter [Thermoanaerobaculia bacterium]
MSTHVRRRSRAAVERQKRGGNTRTIIIALLANLVVAIAKLITGLISHSTAMLAESAHSFADTANEVLLALSLRRAKRPPDPMHPLGHGRERFLWALMAAIASFLIGGCFSIGIAIYTLITPGEAGHMLGAWIVLAISFVAELISWTQSVRQARNDARSHGRDFWTYLRLSSDPVVRAIVVEDSAALVGLVLAAAGLLIRQLTGSAAADSIASILIGVLLGITAFGLARPLAEFLVGRSLPQPLLDELRNVVEQSAAVEEIELMQAVYVGPEEAIVVARIHVQPMKSSDLTRALDELDEALRKKSPYVSEVFLDVRPHDG